MSDYCGCRETESIAKVISRGSTTFSKTSAQSCAAAHRAGPRVHAEEGSVMEKVTG
jgi:hypothetical protein